MDFCRFDLVRFWPLAHIRALSQNLSDINKRTRSKKKESSRPFDSDRITQNAIVVKLGSFWRWQHRGDGATVGVGLWHIVRRSHTRRPTKRWVLPQLHLSKAEDRSRCYLRRRQWTKGRRHHHFELQEPHPSRGPLLDSGLLLHLPPSAVGGVGDASCSWEVDLGPGAVCHSATKLSSRCVGRQRRIDHVP